MSRTALLGVLGFPARHSLSPRLHNRAFQHLAMDAVYLPLEVPPAGLSEALRGARSLGFRGLNVTMPHKEAVFALAEGPSARARACGSANTLAWDDAGHLVADSTDGPAIWAALGARGVESGESRLPVALLLGAGGAARAAAFALAERGFVIRICARHRDRSADLAQALAGQGLTGEVVPWSERDAACGDARVVVQATPLGGALRPKASPLGEEAAWRDDGVLVEMAYGEGPTPLETRVRNDGHAVIDGREVLARQAALSWELWFGVPGPLAVMEEALREDLAHRGAPAGAAWERREDFP